MAAFKSYRGLCVSHRDFHLTQNQPVISVALVQVKSAQEGPGFSWRSPVAQEQEPMEFVQLFQDMQYVINSK